MSRRMPVLPLVAAFAALWAASAGIAFAGVTATGTMLTSDIPGQPLGSASVTVTGHVDATAAPDAVYAIPLRDGRYAVLTLGAPAGADLDLCLYSPDATSVHVSPPLAASLSPGRSDEIIEYAVPAGSTGRDHYVRVRAASGAADFTLAAQDLTATAVAGWAAPPSVPYLVAYSMSGTLTAGGPGTGLAGRTVVLYSSADRSAWRRVTTATTGADGSFSFRVCSASSAWFRAAFEGDDGHGPSVAPASRVLAYARLTRPRGVYAIPLGRRLAVQGNLMPVKRSGVLRLLVDRYVGGRWVRAGSAATWGVSYGTYQRFYGRVSTPARGRWRVRAFFPGDALNLATSGGYLYYRVY